MINAFSALLEARDSSLGRFRSYRLEAGTDLFGAWLVEVTYGRIGTPGRSVRYVVGNEAEAKRLVHKTLRRRATARQRIGVSYRFRELIDPWEWVPLTVQKCWDTGVASLVNSRIVGRVGMRPICLRSMASAIIGAVSSVLSLTLGTVIGQLYDNTLIPITCGFLGLGIVSLLLMRAEQKCHTN